MEGLVSPPVPFKSFVIHAEKKLHLSLELSMLTVSSFSPQQLKAFNSAQASHSLRSSSRLLLKHKRLDAWMTHLPANQKLSAESRSFYRHFGPCREKTLVPLFIKHRYIVCNRVQEFCLMPPAFTSTYSRRLSLHGHGLDFQVKFV